MTHTWLDGVLEATETQAVVRAVLMACEGSCPREVGADMLVWADRTEGTIGGGALEHDVIAAARAMLEVPAGAWQRSTREYHLGPDLNQCCGGAATVLLERFGASERHILSTLVAIAGDLGVTRPTISGIAMERVEYCGDGALVERRADGLSWVTEPVRDLRTPLYLYGAGHVARALVAVLAGLPFAVTWIDVAEDRFPAQSPPDVRVMVSGEPQVLVPSARGDAYHLVMTHSHTLDESIVAAVLAQDTFAYLGLIGSATKAARFRQRLRRAGFNERAIERIVSPIGIAGLGGKVPASIAISVAADLLARRAGQRLAVDGSNAVD